MTAEPRVEPAPDRPATRNRSWRSLLLPALLVFAVLIALGTWQIERKAWKEALIASLTERLAAPLRALPPARDWAKLDRAGDEYRRVKFTASFDNAREALVFAAASASGSGSRATRHRTTYCAFGLGGLTSFLFRPFDLAGCLSSPGEIEDVIKLNKQCFN
jgi:hypothetical protein